jgi:beta-phosphoglucomutase-like phosphatase (HAD superfamily)
MLAAIIFDVEGTLIDCVPHVLACWQAVLAAAGQHVSRKWQGCS